MGNKRDGLGDRMKNNYENRAKTYLLRRTPVIIRLDGKAFHTFTRGFVKPFDARLMRVMQETTLELCRNIQGCVFGYTQSDEITLVLVDYNALDTDAWFDYGVEKMCSVAASMCTLYFNRIFARICGDFIKEHASNAKDKKNLGDVACQVDRVLKAYMRGIKNGGLFDARVFNVPEGEVTNCVLWRQNDATRNSVSSLAQAYFSPKELHGKNSSQMQDMMMEKYSINWNNLSIPEKRGTAIIKNGEGDWVIDEEMPILRGEGREYLESRIHFEEEG
jgi:tRNA(His) 5'-end guanylyltransferase